MLDEQKIKDLMSSIVDDIFSCFEVNQYTASVKRDLHIKIAKTNLLPTPVPCATVKKQLMSVKDAQEALREDRL